MRCWRKVRCVTTPPSHSTFAARARNSHVVTGASTSIPNVGGDSPLHSAVAGHVTELLQIVSSLLLTLLVQEGTRTLLQLF
jgi:hypothetical protein